MHNGGLEYEYRSGISSLLVLDDTIDILYLTVLFKPFDPFYDSYNEMMGRLANGGFLNYLDDSFENSTGLKRMLDKTGPQVLTIEHLMIGFQFFMAALAVSLIGFIVEITFVRGKKLTIVKTKLWRYIVKYLKPKQDKYRTRNMKKKKALNEKCRTNAKKTTTDQKQDNQ